ncbi:unnamed protein product [Vitrella brassicaformis CCMP3155]|uniref:Ribosomal protein L28 n=1 Tax=Vitrella brassicaformis (strain CCMP3155) TaxID=1169540 RepID=A0A0G4GBU4_VITBC|nr:unnamed protein product [Vitrella brassicaformis CCMP3155]|mmetsp:Transcript_28927/g.72095  ORF Transcript_28927/g.72095 Transcript_28927/m.72095 type:complete len:312 (-) Transcript_28927:356-1291(-)|eukprot:CEM26611.1 unnamed protein product [Vitrella brassicaformis CCMP3155]
MPKNLSLFGKYLRKVGKIHWRGFKRHQIAHPIPVKAYGREPTAAASTGLYHDEDFNYYSYIVWTMDKFWTKAKPNTFKKDIKSKRLNTEIKNLRVTTSALHAMDDMGGFDEYILRTPPQEMRSNMGERMRNVMYFYQHNPEVREWALPWKVFLRFKDQRDPYFARHWHYLRKERNEKWFGKACAKFSPYYLPPEEKMHPERQEFLEGSEPPQPINMWWKESPALEQGFRRRLKEAKSFEEAHPDHHEPDGFREGYGHGGGGQHGNVNPMRKHKKEYKWHNVYKPESGKKYWGAWMRLRSARIKQNNKVGGK